MKVLIGSRVIKSQFEMKHCKCVNEACGVVKQVMEDTPCSSVKCPACGGPMKDIKGPFIGAESDRKKLRKTHKGGFISDVTDIPKVKQDDYEVFTPKKNQNWGWR